ncbi:MAG: PilZ domain-containing protein [Elusimicrobiota bacterium]|nr:PilZ domain-containing protein [Elusimicrobiota bacterium]
MSERDKRQARRDKHDSVIEILDAAGKFSASGRLSDFSTTGASFSVSGGITVPEKFRARLRLLGKGVMEVEASVVRTTREKNATRYGVKFDSVKKIYPTGELKDTWQ